MDHGEHAPGTSINCADCATLALEPGWYRALREEHVLVRIPDSLLILEGDDIELILPDLEALIPPETEA
jgi:hypothetical protein